MPPQKNFGRKPIDWYLEGEMRCRNGKGKKRETFLFLIPVYLFYIIGVVKVIENKKIVTYPYDCSFNVAKHTCLHKALMGHPFSSCALRFVFLIITIFHRSKDMCSEYWR